MSPKMWQALITVLVSHPLPVDQLETTATPQNNETDGVVVVPNRDTAKDYTVMERYRSNNYSAELKSGLALGQDDALESFVDEVQGENGTAGGNNTNTTAFNASSLNENWFLPDWIAGAGGETQQNQNSDQNLGNGQIFKSLQVHETGNGQQNQSIQLPLEYKTLIDPVPDLPAGGQGFQRRQDAQQSQQNGVQSAEQELFDAEMENRRYREQIRRQQLASGITPKSYIQQLNQSQLPQYVRDNMAPAKGYRPKPEEKAYMPAVRLIVIRFMINMAALLLTLFFAVKVLNFLLPRLIRWLNMDYDVRTSERFDSPWHRRGMNKIGHAPDTMTDWQFVAMQKSIQIRMQKEIALFNELGRLRPKTGENVQETTEEGEKKQKKCQPKPKDDQTIVIDALTKNLKLTEKKPAEKKKKPEKKEKEESEEKEEIEENSASVKE